MKENSTEEDIKIINNFITYFNKNIQNGNKADLTVLGEEINALEHILSDYKRVLEMNEILLKENEQLRTEVNSLKKENEELKEENFNLQCIAKQYIELHEEYKKLYERSIR